MRGQQTFWDGDEAENIESEKVAEAAAKIRLAGLERQGMFVAPEAKEAAARKPKRDFRIHKESKPEAPLEPEAPEEPMTPEHLAAQLVKLYWMGIIKGPDDPEAKFYAKLIAAFNGTVEISGLEEKKLVLKAAE